MKIESHDWTAKQVFNQGYFVIPRFQRPYSWDRDQVEEFWEDAISEKPEQYFIGSMVFFKDGDDMAVVDGQQRLTTIVTALCALRDIMDAEGAKSLANGIHNIIERRDVNDKLRFCLRTESSYPFFQECILNKSPKKKEIPAREEEERLKLAYEYALERIGQEVEAIKGSSTIKKEEKLKMIEAQLVTIRERLLGLKLIFVSVDDEEDAYTIFETLNTRGKDLRTSDLVKTHFTRMLKQKNADVDRVRDRWNEMMQTLQSSEAGINPDTFLLHWWLSREEYTTQKKLFKKFRRLVVQGNADSMLDAMVADASWYRTIREPSSRKWAKDEWPIKRSLEGFQALGVEQQLPIVLSLVRELDDKGIAQKAIAASLRVIENFHFLGSSIAERRSSGGTSMMYASHARGVFKAGDAQDKRRELSDLKSKLRRKMPSLEEVRAGFAGLGYSKAYTKHKRLVQYLLEEIDGSLMRSRPPDYARMTIEHIAPQAGHGLKQSDIASVGNLILVPADLNNLLANKTFSQKKALLLKHQVPLDPIVAGASDWGAAEIRARREWIAKKAYDEIWAIR